MKLIERINNFKWVDCNLLSTHAFISMGISMELVFSSLLSVVISVAFNHLHAYEAFLRLRLCTYIAHTQQFGRKSSSLTITNSLCVLIKHVNAITVQHIYLCYSWMCSLSTKKKMSHLDDDNRGSTWKYELKPNIESKEPIEVYMSLLILYIRLIVLKAML